MGERMMAGLREMQSRHSDLVSEVRGIGLMIGVEFSMDEVGELVIAQMTKRGVIAAYTLNNPRVIRIEPPLIINEAQVDEAVRVFDEAITETGELLAMIA
jgi:putrescine aminotransferase